MSLFHIAIWSPDFDDYSLDKKIQTIIDTFKKAYLQMKSMANPKESDQLYVFLCPEWTFVNKDSTISNKCYSKVDLTTIVNAFSKLSKDYPDALIIAGSIRLRKEFNTKKMEKYGALFTKQNDKITIQEYISKYHFTKNSALIFFNGKRFSYNKKIEALDIDTGLDDKFYPGSGSGVFKCDQLNVGIEICADHAESQLKKEIQLSGEKIDLHLVISNTIGNKFANIAALSNSDSFIIFAHCPAGFENTTDSASVNAGVWIGNQSTEYRKIKESISSKFAANIQIYSNIFTSKEHISSNQFVGIWDDLPDLEGDETSTNEADKKVSPFQALS